jgi:hypothetical protein
MPYTFGTKSPSPAKKSINERRKRNYRTGNSELGKAEILCRNANLVSGVSWPDIAFERNSPAGASLDRMGSDRRTVFCSYIDLCIRFNAAPSVRGSRVMALDFIHPQSC